MDLGASHGGFTSVLLAEGAKKVFTIDVAYGILDYKLRVDPRVKVLERKNVREIQESWFEGVQSGDQLLLTCDVAFMSLKTILTSVCSWANSSAIGFKGLFLLKPQFEDSKSTDKGILKDETRRLEIISGVIDYAKSLGLVLLGTHEIDAEPGKNRETFLYLEKK